MTHDVTPPLQNSPTREEIATAAADVNAASSELGETIEAIESFLEARGLGVPAWVKVKGWEDHYGAYWKRELGYDRFGRDWHIAIRESRGNVNDPEPDDPEVWPFNRAPRKTRISAVDKIPELLAELIKEAERTARRLREKAAEATAFAATLKISPATKKSKK